MRDGIIEKHRRQFRPVLSAAGRQKETELQGLLLGLAEIVDGPQLDAVPLDRDRNLRPARDDLDVVEAVDRSKAALNDRGPRAVLTCEVGDSSSLFVRQNLLDRGEIITPRPSSGTRCFFLGDELFFRLDRCSKPGERGGGCRGIEPNFGTCNTLVQGAKARKRLDGSAADRKSILKQLTKSGEAVADRIDNLISLFRASHLFSQDNQALTQSFKDHCNLPREIVSRMLAFEDYENALKKSANIVTILENSLNALASEISDTTASLKADRSELDGLRRTIKDKSNIGALNAELRNLRAALKDTPQQAALERVISDADRSQSELRQLLSQLQKHISDGNCPLCGVDHGSQDKLVRHIQKQMSLDSAGTARIELAGLRQRNQEIIRELAGNREAQKSALAQLSLLANDRIARDLQINVWANTADGLGLNASAGLSQLTRQIAANFTEARSEIEDSNAAVKADADAADAARAARDTLTKSISQQESAKIAANAELERIRKALTTLRSDPRLSGVTLDSGDDELTEAEQDRSGLLDELRQSHNTSTQEQTRLKGLIDAESRTIAELAGQLPVLRRRANENEQARKTIIARLADADLPEDSDEQELIGKLGEKTQGRMRRVSDSPGDRMRCSVESICQGDPGFFCFAVQMLSDLAEVIVVGNLQTTDRTGDAEVDRVKEGGLAKPVGSIEHGNLAAYLERYRSAVRPEVLDRDRLQQYRRARLLAGDHG